MPEFVTPEVCEGHRDERDERIELVKEGEQKMANVRGTIVGVVILLALSALAGVIANANFRGKTEEKVTRNTLDIQTNTERLVKLGDTLASLPNDVRTVIREEMAKKP